MEKRHTYIYECEAQRNETLEAGDMGIFKRFSARTIFTIAIFGSLVAVSLSFQNFTLDNSNLRWNPSTSFCEEVITLNDVAADGAKLRQGSSEAIQLANGAAIALAVRESIAKISGPDSPCSGRPNRFLVKIQLGEGTWHVKAQGAGMPTSRNLNRVTANVADFSMMPRSGDRALIFTGAGRDTTKLLYNEYSIPFFGVGANNLTISRMTLQAAIPAVYEKDGIKYTHGRKTTQGEIMAINASEGYILLRLDAGYPEPPALDASFREECGLEGPSGIVPCDNMNAIKRFARSSLLSRPYFPFTANKQVPLNAYSRENNFRVAYTAYQKVDRRTYKIFTDTNDFRVGELVALKSKHASVLVFAFYRELKNLRRATGNINIENIRFLGEGRGILKNVEGSKYINNRIETMEPIGGIEAAMATCAGGVQLHEGHSHIVEGNYFRSLGDDGIAMFNLTRMNAFGELLTSRISSNIIHNSWNRGIYLEDRTETDEFGTLSNLNCVDGSGCARQFEFPHIVLRDNILDKSYINYANSGHYE